MYDNLQINHKNILHKYNSELEDFKSMLFVNSMSSYKERNDIINPDIVANILISDVIMEYFYDNSIIAIRSNNIDIDEHKSFYSKFEFNCIDDIKERISSILKGDIIILYSIVYEYKTKKYIMKGLYVSDYKQYSNSWRKEYTNDKRSYIINKILD